MALVASFFGTRFPQKQLEIMPMNSNKRLPWKCSTGALQGRHRRELKQQTIYVKTRTGEKEQNDGQQKL